jgi:dipeptidyl aminopeptidase/acylaminoacyl peptidase
MFGTTEEVFFNYFDFEVLTGEKDNAVAQKAYNQFNPINYVDKMEYANLNHQGGKDFRVPIGQGRKPSRLLEFVG